MWYSIVVAALTAYMLGNINGAVCISRIIANEDVRSQGSGNAGLTNFVRNYGAASSVFVILTDMGKAVLACAVGGLLLQPYGLYDEGVALGGLFLILGHDFPALLGFKGGKGILSGVTVALMMDWRLGLLVFGIFLAAYLLTGYVSLGSVLSSGSFWIFYGMFHRESLLPIVCSFLMGVIIVWMHRGNIRRLIKGEERKTNLLGKGKQK